MIRGRLHYLISYDDGGTFVIFALDAKTRLLTRVQFLEDDPLHGDSHNELFFSDWRQVGDIKMPFSSLWRINARVIMTEQIDEIQNNVVLLEDDFFLPLEILQAENGSPVRGELSSHWLLRRIAMASPVDEDQTRIRVLDVAPGVVQVTGGSHHSLGIAMQDHIIVVDAPLYEARSTRVIDSLERRFPGKPIRTIVNTHFHNDHAGGLRTYVAAGIGVVTSKVNAAFFQQVFSAEHTLVPDLLQRTPKEASLETVDTDKPDKKVLTDDTRRVEISHAEDMLVVFLPQEKLLFVTDLFSPGAPYQVQTWSAELLAAIEHYGLDVERLVGGHGGVAPIAELYQAVGSQLATVD
jgi:glyoxylase-like metal-dependent hydrolase (beta-lactamase superfamily II)